MKRLGKLLEFVQNASESIPYFRKYTIWLEITLTLVGFWLAKRGIERFLEKRGCRSYFRLISKSRWSRFRWVSKSLFWGVGGGGGGDFCILVWNFILLFFFLFVPTGLGPSDLSFFLSVWSWEVEFFRVHRYSLSKRASTFRQKIKTKQYIDGLALASNFDFGNFISFYLYHLLEIFGA